MTRPYRAEYFRAYNARPDVKARLHARYVARYVPVPPEKDRRRRARLNIGLATGTVYEQVRYLFGRDFKRHQIATLLGVSRARITQILNGRKR